MSKIAKMAAGLVLSVAILGLLEVLARTALGPPVPELAATLPGGDGELIRRTADGIQPAYQATRRQAAVGPDQALERRRVVWLGGSSIHGGTQGITRSQEAPGRMGDLLGVESLNFGGIGMDTVSIGAIIEDVVSIEPDVLVVYTGHNELGNAVFTGRYSGPSTARIARWRARLGQSRLYQALEMTLRGREILALPSATTEGQFVVTATTRNEVYWRYEERLRHLVSVASENGIPVVLATLMSNPAAPSIEFQCPEAMKRAGFSAVRPEAVPVDGLLEADIEVATAMAPQCPDLRWLKARRAGDARALDALRDADPLPVRADRKLNAVVRRVAGETGVTLVDVDGFARVAGGGVEPCAWFIDPMHLTVAGHEALARMVAQGVAPLLAIPPPPLAPAPTVERNMGGCCTEACRARRDF